MRSTQSLQKQKGHLKSQKIKEELFQFPSHSLSINRHFGRLPLPQKEEQLQTLPLTVRQKFRQPKAYTQGELIVDLEIDLDGITSIFSKYLNITKKSEFCEEDQSFGEPCEPVSNSIHTIQPISDWTTDESKLSPMKTAGIQRDILGYYKMKNNEVPLKITPFQTQSFSAYSKEDVKISETISQIENGVKFVTQILSQNLEIIVGFSYEIQKEEKIIQYESEIEEELDQEVESHTQSFEHSPFYHDIQQDTTMINQQQQQNSPQVKGEISPIKNSKQLNQLLQEFQQSPQIAHAQPHSQLFPHFALSTPELRPSRKHTGDNLHMDDEQTTCDITSDIDSTHTEVKLKKQRPQQQQRKRKTSGSYFSRLPVAEMEDENNDESYHTHCSQQSHKTSGSGAKKGDKKNVVKNFVKAFRSYLQAWSNSEEIMAITNMNNKEQLEEYRKEWMVFEKQSHYNNKLIIELIMKKYSSIFTHFLNNKALNWLENSQVQDKQSHREVLSQYIKASQNPHMIQSIIILKSRNC